MARLTLIVAVWMWAAACAQPGPTGEPPAPPASARAQPRPAAPAEEWRDLFNGRDLAGWSAPMGDPAAWAVSNGEIVSAIPGKGEWLTTDEAFGDFELEVEFFLPVGANTGVGIRTASVGDPSYGGFEIQLNDTAGAEPSATNAGAVYRVAPARVMAIRPGAWNRLRVRVAGDRLDAWLNGRRIHDGVRLPRREVDRARPGGGRRGRIALQDNNGSARFRVVRVRPVRGLLSPAR